MYPKQLSMSEVCLGRIGGGARVPYRNCKVFATCTHQLTSGLKNDQQISRSTLLRSAPVYELKRCIKHSTPKVCYKISSSNVHWQLVKRQHNLGPLSVRYRGTGQTDKKWLFIKCQMPGMTIILLSLLGVCQIVNKLLGRFIQGQKVIKFHFLKQRCWSFVSVITVPTYLSNEFIQL